MPEPRSRSATQVPRYLCHHSRGRRRAFCYVYEAGRRRRVYLGAWGTPESKRRYRDLISVHLGERLQDEPTRGEITVEQLVARCLAWGEAHYVKHGRPTGEWRNMKHASRPLLDLFRDEPASAFGPKKLRAVRDHMLHTGKCARRTINARIQRIRRIFRWGVAEELLPTHTWDSLRSLLPLQRGRTHARETAPVDPVPLPLLRQTLPYLTPTVRAMVLVQLLTGMRPGEVLQMRLADIETDGPGGSWVFTPRSHKTEHKGKSRRVVLGKSVQRLLKPFLALGRDAPMFSPVRSEEERRAMRRAARKSKVPPSQQARDERNRATPRRKLRMTWTNATYLRAVYHACLQAGIERWSPGRLRHSFQDMAEQSCGLEAASKALGHAQLGTTEHYRNRIDLDQAAKAMRAVERKFRPHAVETTRRAR